MMTLRSRLGRVERKAGGRPCPALGRLPRCVLVETEEQYEALCVQVQGTNRMCTCERRHVIKFVVLDDHLDERHT